YLSDEYGNEGVVGLPDLAFVAVLVRQIAGVDGGDVGHEPRRAPRALRGEEQVHVVAHERVGVDGARLPRGASAKRREVGGAVLRAGKTGAALAPALHDVQRGVSLLGAGKARHNRKTPRRATALTASVDRVVDEHLVGLALRLVGVLGQDVLDRGFSAQLGGKDHDARKRRWLALGR